MKQTPIYLAIAASSMLITACGGSNKSDETTPAEDPIPAAPEESFTSISNLSTGSRSEPTTVYFDLDNNAVVEISDLEAETNEDWDIAFNRTKVYVNQYASSQVALYYTGNASDYYDDNGDPIVESFINATAETEEDAFNAFESSMIPSEASFETDENVDAIDGFYNYNFQTHVVSANTEAAFIISSDGTYSKFSAVNITTEGRSIAELTLSIATQADDATEFGEAIDVVISAADCAGDLYVDNDTQSVVTESDDWDLRIPCADGGASFEIHIAGDAQAISGESANGLTGVDAENASFYPWVSDITTVRAFVEYGDENSSYGWGEYGVNGGHTLWPNFATYVIRTETADYKFQITSYYDTETSASGSYSFRFEVL